MKKWVLRIILVVIAVVLLVGTLSACGDEWVGFVEVENLQEFVSALNDPGVDKIKVKSGVYGDEANFENLIITRPLTIKGAGESRPVLFGSVIVNLSAGELRGVVIENIEISHSGEYVTKEVDGKQKVDLTRDGRRGILVNNGSVIIKNNYIHLANENPETKLGHPSSAIQLSVLKDAPNQDKLSYSISGNEFGKYSKSQHSSSSGAVAILADIDEGQNLNVSLEQINAIFEDNTFAEGTEGYEAMYDYTKTNMLRGCFHHLKRRSIFCKRIILRWQKV